jgi:ADP-heptose:LPS heptosyltransferase
MFDVKLMRWIDNQVGNLACNLLAATKTATARFRTQPTEYKKIVVMKFFGIGSVVVGAPSLMALRDAYPNAEIHFVSFSSNREILEILDLTDKNWFVDNSSAKKFAASTVQLMRDLRAENFDLVIDFEFFAKFPLVLAGIAGISKSAGFYLTQEPWRRTLLDVSGSYNHYYHTKDIFLSLVYLLATGDLYYLDFKEFKERYQYPRITVAPETRAHVAKLLEARGRGSRRVVLINPNTSPDLAPDVRKWPEERYAELAKNILTEHPDTFVAFIGAKSERTYVERIAGMVKDPRAISLAGELSLKQLLAAFEACDLFVTNDSGPMHLACLVDAPVVGLFFADTPTIFAPLGSRVTSVAPELYSLPLFTVYNGKDVVAGRPVDTIQNTIARAVPVERVMTEVRSLLSEDVTRARPAPLH